MLVLNGAGFLVILLSGLRQTPQSEDTNSSALFCAYYSIWHRNNGETRKAVK